MTRNLKNLLTLATMVATVVAMGGSLLAQTGEEALYEGFDYTDSGGFADVKNLGGTAGGWGAGWLETKFAMADVRDGTASTPDSTQTYGSLDVTGLGATSALNVWGHGTRSTGSALDGFLDAGDTLWFSMLMDNSVAASGKKNGMVLSDGVWSSAGATQESLDTGVTGIGIVQSNFGNILVGQPNAAGSGGTLGDTGLNGASTTFLLGKIEWGADSGTAAQTAETLTIYNPASTVDETGAAIDINGAAAGEALSIPNLAQATFDRVALLTKDQNRIDEIRFGSYAGALGRFAGDADNDKDVDNADIGAAAGAFGGSGVLGKKWSEGDFDGDGDVDNADIGVAAGGFTGSLAGNLTDSGTIADLIYDPATGNLSLDATEAAGGIITSFQLESLGQFIDGNYTSLPPAFGGFFEDVSANTLADSDLSFVGFSGVQSIGNVLAPGLDQLSLEALLTTALYSGSLGSGQFEFDLVIANAIPEPGTGALLALGLATIGFRRRRRQAA